LLNEKSIPTFFYDNRSAIRNVVFLSLVLIYQYCLGNYLLSQAGLYMEQRDDVTANPLLGYFLFLVFIVDSVAFYFKCNEIRYVYLTNIEFFREKKGCLNSIKTGILKLSVFFSIIPNFFFQLIITNSTQNFLLGALMTILVFVKWIFIFYKLFWITKDKRKDENLQPPPLASQFWTDVILTFTSSVIFTITWEQLRVDGGVMIFFFFFLIIPAIYIPARMIFFLQDYYTVSAPRHKRNAFLTGIAAVAFPMMNAFAPVPDNISYKRKVKLDDFSAADTLLFYDKGKFYINVFKTESISYAETDSICHTILEECAANDSLSTMIALRKDSTGFVITMTLPDNRARNNPTVRAPYVMLRSDIQKLFPDTHVRIDLGGYSDGSNIIAKIQ
jgi:hypothetical protein